MAEIGSSILFTPFTLGRLRLRNRIVMAPMTRELSPGGVPGEDSVAYYRRRAEGGVGLVITEGTSPEEAGTYGANVPRLFGAEALRGWARVVEGVHAGGARIVAQLWHVGGWNPSLAGATDSMPPTTIRLSPSARTGAGAVIGEAMTGAQIAHTIDAFGRAAEAAVALGFDGVEIHGAHGYLVDQFFWSATNQRTDRFGGGVEGRVRFAVELIRDLRRRTPPDFPIILRMSQWKQVHYDVRLADTPDELAAILEPLVDAGVDVLHCSTRRFWEPAFAGSPLTLAGWVKKLSGKPTIAVGSVTLGTDYKSKGGMEFAASVPGSIDLAVQLMQQGEFDLLAVGRAMLANPDWTTIVRENRMADLRPYSRSLLESLS